MSKGRTEGARFSRGQEDREYMKVSVRDDRECCRHGDWLGGTEIGMVRSMVKTGGEMERGGEVD
jgi:hypothetical protein